MRISAALKNRVWNEYVGETNGVGECFLGCGTKISKNHFECGHMVSKKNNGPNTCENLRPLCSLCNKSMSSKNMVDFVNENDMTQCKLYNTEYYTEYKKQKKKKKKRKKIKKQFYQSIVEENNKLKQDIIDMNKIIMQHMYENNRLKLENIMLKQQFIFK
jgi:hypothetical protein